MNREEGSYQLSHMYDCFLGTSTTYYLLLQEPDKRNDVFHSSDKVFRRKSKCQGIEIFFVIIDEF